MTQRYPNGSGSSAAIARHPLHPFVAPIPIGALVLAFVSDLVFLGSGNARWLDTSYFLLAAGVTGGIVAAVLGIIETMGVRRARTMGLVWAHAGLNVLVMGLAILSLLIRGGNEGAEGAASLSTFELIVSATIALLLLVSGWLGGEVSYKHGVGVAEEIGADTPDGNLERDPYGRPDIGKG